MENDCKHSSFSQNIHSRRQGTSRMKITKECTENICQELKIIFVGSHSNLDLKVPTPRGFGNCHAYKAGPREDPEDPRSGCALSLGSWTLDTGGRRSRVPQRRPPD
ncbi:uncharacterized protein LOC143268873 [Peromyscus maniculatus bairdii]|uniref:uncharacterized protein LOC143268873 n=1 Tax=Peromyscus maniculatus bairdii TaxID=230844 RepID=UPI003FD56E49